MTFWCGGFLSCPGVQSICPPFLSPCVSCWTESAQAFQTAGGASPAFLHPPISTHTILSLSLSPEHSLPRTPLRGRQRNTQSPRGRKTETQWEATGAEEKKDVDFQRSSERYISLDKTASEETICVNATLQDSKCAGLTVATIFITHSVISSS